MHTITHLTKTTSIFVALIAFAAMAFAQSDTASPADQSYNVMLQALVGSTESSTRTGLPADLSAVTQRLRSNFPFTSYQVVNTFLGRVSDRGRLEYKSVSNVNGKEAEGEPQSFLDWGIGGLQLNDNVFHAQTFRFGARVPVMTGGTREEFGKTVPVVNYESIGLNIANVGVPAGVPTLIGTLSLPKTSGTLFLVLTVEPSGK